MLVVGPLLMTTHALVISCLNYCNALYILEDHPEVTMVQNAVVHALHRFIYVILLLCKLHLLPLSFWVQLKMLVITFTAVYGTRRGYLQDCFSLKYLPILQH